MEGEASVHLLEAIYIHAIQNEVNKICEDNCYGCDISHPSQRKNDCLMMDDEERWLLYTADADMQVKCKYCIWSEFIEATRLLKMIHRENMRTHIASLAPMPETTMNLPHRVAFFIKPVDEIFTDTFLPLVTSMTDANVVPLQYPFQHFHRNYRVSVSDCVLLEESFSEDKVAGRGNGQIGCERSVV
jgi:hypothetical protein